MDTTRDASSGTGASHDDRPRYVNALDGVCQQSDGGSTTEVSQ